MEMCKALTLRLKPLNKHNMIHIKDVEMEHATSDLTKS